MASEFKIGRLRFTWAGSWTPATFYNRDAVVNFQGKAYVCLEPNTSSSNFYTDLNAVPFPKWSLIIDGKRWIGDWQTGQAYALGDIVSFAGGVYYATTPHVSTDFAADASNWGDYFESLNWTLAWQTSRVYGAGDLVKYGGNVYKCIVNHTSAATNTLGLEADLANWELYFSGIDYKGIWSANTRYKLNDVVKLESNLYKCVTYNADATFVTANWSLWLPGIEFAGAWASNITYQRGEVVSYGGYDYVSLTENNLNNVPSIEAADWELLTTGYSFKGEYNGGTYLVGDIVRLNGRLYEAVLDHTAQSPVEGSVSTTYVAAGSTGTTVKVLTNTGIKPGMVIVGQGFTLGQTVVSTNSSDTVILDRAPDGAPSNSQALTFTGVNSTYWSLLVPGIRWATKWQPFTQYNVGDIVVWKNNTYLAIQNNNSSLSTVSRPDLDVTNQYWTLYIPHSRKNSLNSFGDLQVYANNEYSAVPIGQENYILKVVGSTPTWSQLHVVPNVLYVAPNGIDRPDYGRTWDQPWKTIAYACSQIINIRGGNVLPVNTAENVTIFVKTGTYKESLPISIPASVAIVGDELRGTVIEPATSVKTFVTSSDETTDKFTCQDTAGMVANMPLQFDAPFVNNVDTAFGGITSGVTYYIVAGSITPTTFSISATLGGPALSLTTGTGRMVVYAGDCLKDMFYMRDGTGLRNMTLSGLMGTLTAEDQYLLRRPTGGAYASLDPGINTTDSSVWITKRSPYVQNVTTFGKGAVGAKIDGTLHAGGNKSIVANDFTQIISDGIGIWCTGPGALTECISVFCYYGYSGYFAEDGGRIRAANGNSSYGTYGVIALGFDSTETPATGTVYNQSSQTQAQVQSAFGTVAQILRLNFSNAGINYNQPTTNLLAYSNEFDNWPTDGNLLENKIYTAPTGISEAWSFTNISNTPGQGYLYENIPVTPTGATYTNLSAVNISGSGVSAVFTVRVTATSYVVTVTNGGSGYVTGNTMYISGSQLGGLNSVNDCIIEVASLAGSTILTVNVTGTVPLGSAQAYTCSIYVKKGTATNVTLEATFSGTDEVISRLNYNLQTGALTPSAASGGLTPTQYGAINVLSGNENSRGWYRIWLAAYDVTGQNNQLQFRVYPTGLNSAESGLFNYFYGSQVEISDSNFTPSFYLEVVGTTKYTSYANYNIIGAGTGVITVGDELRSKSVFQTRISTDSNGITGGSGYLTASNNAQEGDGHVIKIAQSDNNTNANYTGMRIFINSGAGAGQYGYISYYDEGSKDVHILKESFDALPVVSTAATTNLITLANGTTTETLYVDMPVQFIPTYYTTTVTSTSLSQVTVTAAVGGQINTLTVSSTVGLYVNQPVTFTGGVFTTVNPNTIYYIYSIIDSTTIQITEQLFGNVWLLNSGSGNMTMNFTSNTGYVVGNTTNMVVNYPIQFTGNAIGGITVGKVYYVNDIISATGPFNPTGVFSISNALVEVTVTSTSSSTNAFTVVSTNSLVVLNPIVFSEPIIGGTNIIEGQKYYISRIIDATSFQVSSTLTTVTATATQATSNLITVSSTAGFIPNQPVVFTGTTFGNIQAETTYYILAVNNATTFTISQSPGGGALLLTTASGSMITRTAGSPVSLTSGTGGSMLATSTAKKELLSFGIGSMSATFSTALFGGVDIGQDYYITTINAGGGGAPATIQVSETLGGPAITLTSKSGSMNLAQVGWDHFNVGTPIETNLDFTSVYFIEPRTVYSEPDFIASPATLPVNLAPGTSWKDIEYGLNNWMAVPDGNATGAYSTDGSVWLSIALPESQTWSGVAYGNNYWVIISSSDSKAWRSNSNGQGWRSSALPNNGPWTHIKYGNGVFVAISAGTNRAAYSTDYGFSWTSATLPASANWSSIDYGNGIFVAIASGGTVAAYSTNGGASWSSSTLPFSTTWSSIAFGNNLFHAVSSTSSRTAWTFDGSTWYSSNLSIAADIIEYGQGVFTAVKSGSTDVWVTEGGGSWKKKTTNNPYNYGCMSFGFTSTTYNGHFASLSGQGSGVVIQAGAKTKGRALITSGVMTGISEWEPGSNYSTAPTVTFVDPNVTNLAVVTPRLGNGVLSSPSMVNKGSGYNTNSTYVTVSGNGYADQYQTGLTIVVNNLNRLPNPGDSLTIAGNDTIYKVTSAFAVFGTTAPNLEANISISPDMTVALSPENNAQISIRSKYSQARLTNHDFLNIGYGSFETSNYPGIPDSGYVASSQNQTVEANFGRVFYTSTDQDGNFKVGSLFGVQQSTGIVTLSASQFGLTGLETLSLGGISVGGSSVIIKQFSTDGTFTANSDEILPTQKAIKTYLTSRLSQGGSNTFTGQLTAGLVTVGGPNKIGTTVPNGSVKMQNKVNFTGPLAGVDGEMQALEFFMRNSTHRTP